MKNRRSRHETAVQGTNDSSIVSKHSMVTHGYFADHYLDEVVKQPCRRAPLINRGYYVRSLVIENVHKTFLQQYSGQLSQIVCLGAGYDTAFYRLFKAGLLAHCHYYEVDFDTVLSHKKSLIETSPLLSDCVSEVAKSEDDCTYKLIPCDLKEPEKLTALLSEAGIDWSVPTLLVSECVLTYLTSAQSAEVINWAGSHFANAVLAVYEQTHPSDPFGQVMLQHFRKQGSPIEVACSTPELHVERLLENSWPAACCHTALDCYQALVSKAELHRISSLEPFDEFEEWHMMAQHYVLASGYKGCCTEIPCFKNRCSRHYIAAPRTQKEKCTIRCFPVSSTASSSSNTTTFVERFAHSSVVTCDNAGSEALVVVGGFGVLPSQQRQHQRINTVAVFPLSASEDTSDSLISMERSPVLLDGIVPDNNMFIRSVGRSPTEILLFEGRSSPTKCGSLVHRLALSTPSLTTEPASSLLHAQDGNHRTASDAPAFSDSDGDQPSMDSGAESSTADTDDRAAQLCYSCSEVLCSGTPPCSRWRYTVTPCTVQGKSTVVAFGGRTPDSVCLADTYALDIKCAAWTKLQITSNFSPSRRHSHSASLWKDRKIVVCGGLNDAERLCADAYWLMDISPRKEVQWSKLCFDPPLPPRYSHSSHILGDTLILVGGVSTGSSQPSIVLADLCSRKWQELALQTSTGEALLLHNHTSHVLRRPSVPHPVLLLAGGGGNCFSFGTHFNSGPYTVELVALKW